MFHSIYLRVRDRTHLCPYTCITRRCTQRVRQSDALANNFNANLHVPRAKPHKCELEKFRDAFHWVGTLYFSSTKNTVDLQRSKRRADTISTAFRNLECKTLVYFASRTNADTSGSEVTHTWSVMCRLRSPPTRGVRGVRHRWKLDSIRLAVG